MVKKINNDAIREIGGSSLKLWLGRRSLRKSNRIQRNGDKVIRFIRVINYFIYRILTSFINLINYINGRRSEYYLRRSDKLIKAGTKTIISNPTCKFINHCTMIFNFTIDNSDKYQLVHEGRFTNLFKLHKEREDNHKKLLESGDIDGEFDELPLGENEMYLVILEKRDKWFKKG